MSNFFANFFQILLAFLVVVLVVAWVLGCLALLFGTAVVGPVWPLWTIPIGLVLLALGIAIFVTLQDD